MSETNAEKLRQIASTYAAALEPNGRADACRDEQWGFVRRHLPQEADAPILDAGCGNGKYTVAILETGRPEVTAIDLFEQGFDPHRYVQASVSDAPFRDASFDFICSLSVIFYLDDPADAIREFHRLLRPGGRVVISCHTRYSLFTLERWLRLRLGLRSATHLRHAKFLSSLQYSRMMRDAGFELMEVDGFRVSYFAEHARRLLRRFGLAQRSPGPDRPRPRLAGWIRSMVGYHAVLVGRKPRARPSNRPASAA